MSLSSEFRRLWTAVKSTIRIGATVAVTQESGNMPLQDVSFLGKKGPSVPLFPYGFYARAPADVHTLIFAYGGRSENRWHMVSSARTRPQIDDGEVVMFHPATGAQVRLRNSGGVLIDGDLVVTGSISAGDEVSAFDGANTVSDHIHTQNVDSAGDTQVGTDKPTG